MNNVLAAEFEAKLRELEDRKRHWSLQDSVDLIQLSVRYRAECWPFLTKNEKHTLQFRLKAAKVGSAHAG